MVLYSLLLEFFSYSFFYVLLYFSYVDIHKLFKLVHVLPPRCTFVLLANSYCHEKKGRKKRVATMFQSCPFLLLLFFFFFSFCCFVRQWQIVRSAVQSSLFARCHTFHNSSKNLSVFETIFLLLLLLRLLCQPTDAMCVFVQCVSLVTKH